MFTISLLLLSSHSFAAKLITCDDTAGNHLIFSASSFSGAPMLSLMTSRQHFGFYGTEQIAMLQHRAGSNYIDAADRKNSIRYDNIQFEIFEQDEFETTLKISKVDGCTHEVTQLAMHCTSREVVFKKLL